MIKFPEDILKENLIELNLLFKYGPVENERYKILEILEYNTKCILAILEHHNNTLAIRQKLMEK